MPFVVTDYCIKCKFTRCVNVCPMECFHEGVNMLVINPSNCIDCGLCEPECASYAILSDYDSYASGVYKSINAFFSGATRYEETNFSSWPADLVDKAKTAKNNNKAPWRRIVNSKGAMPNAYGFVDVTGKINDLDANSA